MEDKKLIEIVMNLNEWLYEVVGHNNPDCFRFSTDGYIQSIEFNQMLLWDSENDEREYIEETDEYEDMEMYVKKRFNNYITHLQGIKFII